MKLPKWAWIALVAVWLAALIVASYLTGAVVSCQSGEGELHGLQCLEMKQVGVCTYDDKEFIVPDGVNLTQET